MAGYNLEDCKAVSKKHIEMQHLDSKMKAQALYYQAFIF